MFVLWRRGEARVAATESSNNNETKAGSDSRPLYKAACSCNGTDFLFEFMVILRGGISGDVWRSDLQLLNLKLQIEFLDN